MAMTPPGTPGVYVTELDAFPPSIAEVPTAVPGFVGYTEKAETGGKSVLNQPIKIGSMDDYQAIFGGAPKTLYRLVEVSATQGAPPTPAYDIAVVDPSGEAPTRRHYALEAATPRFYLYRSLQLFYANGGGECFVVSVGSTAGPVEMQALLAGLAALGEKSGPTLLAVPDATSLPSDEGGDGWISSEYQAVVRAMLEQCGRLEDRFSILDVYGTLEAEPASFDAVIEAFHEAVGTECLDYGAAYFPFLDTTLVASEIDYTSIDLADPAQLALLQAILGWENLDRHRDRSGSKLDPRGVSIQAEIEALSPTDTPAEARTRHQTLLTTLPLLQSLEKVIAGAESRLPPSGAIAGVFTAIDHERGVWNAPANVSLSQVTNLTFPLTPTQQEDLNVPVDGKAVNALRSFPSRGVVVWGARTLDGNNPDYRYIQVRRTLIYIEQSIERALDPFVFAANDAKTWATVVSMVSGFLQQIWSRGGLMGASASEAFSVQCGLGNTMTPQDILDGYMIVQVTLQMVRPAEFIELTFKQKMERA